MSLFEGIDMKILSQVKYRRQSLISKDHLGTNIRIGCCKLTFSGNNEVNNIYFRKEEGQCKRESGDSNRLVAGNSDNGDAANANWDHPDNSNDNVGFRAAVVLSSRRWPALDRAGLIFRRTRILSTHLASCLFPGGRIPAQGIFYYRGFSNLYTTL